MTHAQALAAVTAPEPRLLGPIVTARCEARCCPDRSAPVFVVFGLAGLQILCSTCRNFQREIVRRRLLTLRRTA